MRMVPDAPTDAIIVDVTAVAAAKTAAAAVLFGL